MDRKRGIKNEEERRRKKKVRRKVRERDEMKRGRGSISFPNEQNITIFR